MTPKLSLAALGTIKGVKKVLAPSKWPSKWLKKLLSRKKKIMSRSFLNSGTLIVICYSHQTDKGEETEGSEREGLEMEGLEREKLKREDVKRLFFV